MRGTATATLAPLDGWEHIVQSLHDIFTTPLGSRVLRRDYGSRIPALQDAPMNEDTLLDLIVAAAEAIDRWEPRVRLEHVRYVEADASGRAALDVTLTDLETGEATVQQVGL